MSLLAELHKPDILDCISHLSSDEVFTPPRVVNEILDGLPQELFQNPDTKFLDPCCKSGVFLREIAKRLIVGLKDKIPDLEKRLEHIFKNQLFGLAITELTGLLSRRSVYCSKDASSEYSIISFGNPDGNIKYEKTHHVWADDKCEICGAPRSEYDRGDDFETHAYSFIHTDERENPELFTRLKEMNFDVIIGNPPYQLNDGGNGASAKPIYNFFVEQAKRINPRYITMIIPARWYSGGKGLDSFRDEMLNDHRLRVLHDFLDASECFPGVEIKGGVCYFLWDRDNEGLCEVNTHIKGEIVSSMQRNLLEEGCTTFIRYNESISILKKVLAKKEKTMDTQVSSRKPFGLATNFSDYLEDADNENGIKTYAYKKVFYIDKNYKIEKNQDLISKWKVLAPKAIGSGDGREDWVKPVLAEPNSLCTETYVILGAYDDEKTAKNLISYTQTKFFHLLLTLRKVTQDATAKVYQFIPIQDFSEEWTDDKLYKKYELTEDEINFIESMISSRVSSGYNG